MRNLILLLLVMESLSGTVQTELFSENGENESLFEVSTSNAFIDFRQHTKCWLISSTLPQTSNTEIEVVARQEKSSEQITSTVSLQMYFLGNSIELRSSSKPELEKLKEYLAAHPTVTAEIIGHVCCENRRSFSKKRARTIYKILVSKGINKKRLSFKGMGNTEPLAFPERNSQDRAANRRIEVTFYGTPEEISVWSAL